ncbi:MAG: hypothetical protein FJX77_00510 [Armatimonadetes bacterium]|nr:hypothetical protein [Armatimonadota bacterium]
MGGPEAAAALLPALQDTDPDVRWQAVVSLGRSRDLSVISSLGERITDPVAHVRRAAAQALGALRTAEAVLPLLIGLADPDSAVADAAATALASIGAPAVEPLCQALDSTSPAIRLRAARTLGLVGNRDALPALQARLPVLGLGGERHGGVVVTIRTAIRCIEESTHQIGGLPRTPRASEPDLRARPRAPGASREETGDPPR